MYLPRIGVKFLVCAMSGLGLEFTFQLVLGQWVSACQSVQEFHASGFTSWTLTHTFLADMGGFLAQGPGFRRISSHRKTSALLVDARLHRLFRCESLEIGPG